MNENVMNVNKEVKRRIKEEKWIEGRQNGKAE